MTTLNEYTRLWFCVRRTVRHSLDCVCLTAGLLLLSVSEIYALFLFPFLCLFLTLNDDGGSTWIDKQKNTYFIKRSAKRLLNHEYVNHICLLLIFCWNIKPLWFYSKFPYFMTYNNEKLLMQMFTLYIIESSIELPM